MKVEAYVPSGTNLLTMLTEVRAVYDMFLKPPDINKLKVISGEGTLTSSLHWVSEGGRDITKVWDSSKLFCYSRA